MEYSVIIPAFQCKKTIRNTVQSVIESGLMDFEIIIVDDGSGDETSKVCREIANKFPNVLYIRQENRGVSAARNRGLLLAKGKYVWFVDSDDTVDCGAMLKVAQVMKKYHPDIIFFGMSFDYYYHGKIYRRDNMCCSYEALFSKAQADEFFDELYDNNELTSSCNKIIKRELLIENDIRYNENMFLMEDFLFSLDLFEVCQSVYVISDVIYRYRQSEDEGNAYRRMKRIENLTEYMRPFQERLKNHPTVLGKVYFMLLRQKLWGASVADIKQITEIHNQSQFNPINVKDKLLNDDLENNRYYKIYLDNKRVQLRHRLANMIKHTVLYQIVKHKQ